MAHSFTAFNLGGSGGNAALINANPTAFISDRGTHTAGNDGGFHRGKRNDLSGLKKPDRRRQSTEHSFSGVIADGESPDLPPEFRTTSTQLTGGSLTKVGTGR